MLQSCSLSLLRFRYLESLQPPQDPAARIVYYEMIKGSIEKDSFSPQSDTTCPACFDEAAAVMIDAQSLRNLVPRGRNSAERVSEGMNDPVRGRILGPDSEIESFRAQYEPNNQDREREPEPNYDCSQFEAVNQQKKASSKNLHISSVMNTVCRHDFILLVISLGRGERYAYALLALLVTCGLFSIADAPHKRRVTAWLYDIECKFKPYLLRLAQNLPEDSPFRAHLQELLDMPSATGDGHVLGHKLRCQLFRSARMTLGIGRTDGENCERTQAFLISFTRTLKYSTPLNFRKQLSRVVNKHNFQKLRRLPRSLRKRIIKSDKLISCAQAQEIIRDTPAAAMDTADGKTLQQIHNASMVLLTAAQRMKKQERQSRNICEGSVSSCIISARCWRLSSHLSSSATSPVKYSPVSKNYGKFLLCGPKLLLQKRKCVPHTSPPKRYAARFNHVRQV